MNCRKCNAELPNDAVFCLKCGTKQTQTAGNTKKRGNGQGTAYKRGKYWQAEYCVYSSGNRIRHTKSGFPTKKAALEYIYTLKNAPIAKQNAQTKRTIAYYYDSLLKTDIPKLGNSTQTAYRIAYNKLKSIHDVPIKDISVIMLRDIVAEEAPTFDPAVDMKSLLSKIYALAIADGVVEANIAKYITLPEKGETERIPWSDSEVSTIWKAYEDGEQIAAYLLLMIYTGMMPGEVMICERDMIDIEKRLIQGAGLKTKIRRKTPIVIADIIIPVIEKILEYSKDKQDNKIMIWNKKTFYANYHAFLEKYNLPNLPMYSCRHTTATALAIGAKIAPSIVQRVMRHARITTTQHYIHTQNIDALNAVNQLNKGADSD